MGACCNQGTPKGTPHDVETNKQINSKLREAEKNQPFEHRIILLGPGWFLSFYEQLWFKYIYSHDVLAFYALRSLPGLYSIFVNSHCVHIMRLLLLIINY